MPYQPRYNVAPTQLMPVITNTAPQGYSMYYWGLVPRLSKSKSISPKLYNAAAEVIDQKSNYKGAFKRRRCLIPADGYFAWKEVGKKTQVPHRVQLKNNEVFAIAGIWDEYDDEEENHNVCTFNIITVPANATAGMVNDRMPAILNGPEAEAAWLNENTPENDLKALLMPFDANKMTYYTVSGKVNNEGYDGPDLLKHAPPSDQFGNYTLFS